MSTTVATQPAIPSSNLLVKWSRNAFPHIGLWILVLAMFLGNFAYIGLSDHVSIEMPWYRFNLTCFGLAAMFATIRFFRPATFDWFLHRLWCGGMTALLAFILSSNLSIYNQLTMTQTWPLADGMLISMDHALGFDWLTYVKFMSSSDVMNSWLSFAYGDLTTNGMVLILFMAVLVNWRERVIESAFMIIATGLIVVTFSSFFPAKAAWATLADAEILARLDGKSGMDHIENLMALRGAAPFHIEVSKLVGLATFPSYHTCLALIILLATRGYKFIAPIGAIIGVSIIAATPVYGGHYLVDVLAGAAVTAATFVFWKRYMLPKLALQLMGFGDEAYAFPDRILNLRFGRAAAKRAA
jgi:PAP2 superfamily